MGNPRPDPYRRHLAHWTLLAYPAAAWACTTYSGDLSRAHPDPENNGGVRADEDASGAAGSGGEATDGDDAAPDERVSVDVKADGGPPNEDVDASVQNDSAAPQDAEAGPSAPNDDSARDASARDASARDASADACTPVTCQPPTCTDGVRNQDETDIDCGGVCAPARTCGTGQGCGGPGDCQSVYCAGVICQASLIKAQYGCIDANTPSDAWIQPAFNLVNTGPTALPYSELTIRYWYTNDGAATPVFHCYSASGIGGCAFMTANLSTVLPARPGADRYMQLGFTSTASLAAGASSGLLQPAIENPSATFNEVNDHSYDASKPYSDESSFKDWTHVTVYRNGVLMWGIEP